MKLVLDTSALLYIVDKKVGLEALEGFEIYVPEAVVEELKTLAKRKKKARVALALLEIIKATLCQEIGPADDAVLKCALKLGAVLVTGDEELAERGRRAGIAVGKFYKKQLAIY
ncbi:MAG: PIN domain-containing protein [Pyrobaculum sp.]